MSRSFGPSYARGGGNFLTAMKKAAVAPPSARATSPPKTREPTHKKEEFADLEAHSDDEGDFFSTYRPGQYALPDSPRNKGSAGAAGKSTEPVVKFIVTVDGVKVMVVSDSIENSEIPDGIKKVFVDPDLKGGIERINPQIRDPESGALIRHPLLSIKNAQMQELDARIRQASTIKTEGVVARAASPSRRPAGGAGAPADPHQVFVAAATTAVKNEKGVAKLMPTIVCKKSKSLDKSLQWITTAFDRSIVANYSRKETDPDTKMKVSVVESAILGKHQDSATGKTVFGFLVGAKGNQRYIRLSSCSWHCSSRISTTFAREGRMTTEMMEELLPKDYDGLSVWTDSGACFDTCWVAEHKADLAHEKREKKIHEYYEYFDNWWQNLLQANQNFLISLEEIGEMKNKASALQQKIDASLNPKINYKDPDFINLKAQVDSFTEQYEKLKQQAEATYKSAAARALSNGTPLTVTMEEFALNATSENLHRLKEAQANKHNWENRHRVVSRTLESDQADLKELTIEISSKEEALQKTIATALYTVLRAKKRLFKMQSYENTWMTYYNTKTYTATTAKRPFEIFREEVEAMLDIYRSYDHILPSTEWDRVYKEVKEQQIEAERQAMARWRTERVVALEKGHEAQEIIDTDGNVMTLEEAGVEDENQQVAMVSIRAAAAVSAVEKPAATVEEFGGDEEDKWTRGGRRDRVFEQAMHYDSVLHGGKRY
jgi:hypothetical protein